VISGAKPPNPAAEALRASAAAGENYLNDLLTGGLLDVPGVRVPDSEFDIKPDRRWGHSGGRALVALFVLLVLGAGGGVTWWYYSEQQKAAAVKQHREAAAKVIVTGSFEDLATGAKELAGALERDRKNPRVFADVAWVTALQTLLYGLPPINATEAIAQADRDITKPEQEGYRSLALAKIAVALATLDQESDANESLAKARSSIEDYIAANADDRWARWLLGRAMTVAGQRKTAEATLQSAADGDDGIVPAMIDLADLLVDDGKLDDAMKLYGRALDKSPDHPLALVGEVLAWAERGVEQQKTLEMLNVQLTEKKNMGPRVRAYRALALALAKYQIEDYEEVGKALAGAMDTPPKEPRFLARVALARLLGGDFADAARARAQVAWFGKDKPEPDPVVNLFDAALLVESGLPQRALDTLGELDSTRADLIRAQALLDLGKADKALEAAQAAKDSAPDNLEAEALRVQAAVITAPASKRTDLIQGDLNAIANKMVSKRGRHAEGAALLAVGNPDARTKLEEALANVDEENPNPIAYRTHVLLAMLDLSEQKAADAATHIDAAITANGGYLPALVVKARIALAAGDADTALAAIKPVAQQPELLDASVMLTYAEALAAQSQPTAEDKAAATDLLKKALAAGAPPAEVGRIAALLSPDLPATLGVPGPAGEEPEGEAPKEEPKPKKKHHR
jgi:tetratricopeptide (TPR) repeat protein